MIVIYPLLLSDTVSKTIVPGLAKVIERYLLIYKIDEVLQSAKTGGYKRKLKVQGGKIIMKEEDNDDEDLFLPNSRTKPYTQDELKTREDNRKERDEVRKDNEEARRRREDKRKGKESTRKSRDEERKDAEELRKDRGEARKDKEELRKDKEAAAKSQELGLKRNREAREREKALDNAKSASIDIGTMDMQSLSAEPTWVKIDVQVGDYKESEFLGIKVVPILVKSNEKLVRILMFDKNVKGLHGEILNFGRGIVRGLWKIWQRVWSSVPLIGKGRGTMTGNARQDILLQKTIYSHDNRANIFVSINFQDLDDELFFTDAKSLNKLFNKGWESFVVCDDVNRIAHFVMEDFKGMVSSLNYAMIYQTVGQFKVYESLEDVKRSSSALFKRKMKTTKLIAGSLAKQKLNKYGRK